MTLILDHPFSWGGVVNLDLDGPPGLFACKQSLSGKGSNLTWWKLRGSCFGLFCARTDTIYVSIYLPIYLTIYPSSYLILSYLILSYLKTSDALEDMFSWPEVGARLILQAGKKTNHHKMGPGSSYIIDGVLVLTPANRLIHGFHYFFFHPSK